MYKLNEEGQNLIISFEKISYKAYRDNKGWSCGVGHYIKLPEEKWLLTATLTYAQVVWLFKKDIASFEKEFNIVFGKIKLTGNQVIALMDAVYNCGITKVRNSGLVSAVEIMDKDKISEAFLRLDKGIPSIRQRRLVDIMIFFQKEPFKSSGLDNLVK